MNQAHRLRSAVAVGGAHLGHRTPLAVSLSVLDACNSRCTYCAIPERGNQGMALDEVRRILDEMADMGLQRIVFTGGEPLVRPDIGAIVSHAKALGAFTSLNSNGLLVERRLADLEDLDLLKMSLDGPEEVHDAVRGCPGSFRKVVEALELARAAGKQVWINAVITKHNLGWLRWLADFAREHEVFCEFNHLSPHYLAGDLEPLRPDPEEFREAVDLLLEERKTNPYILDSPSYFRFVRDSVAGRAGEAVRRHRYRCWSGWLFCYVDTNGDVYPCFDLRGAMPARNAVESGFREAFLALPRMRCSECFCSAAIELNFLASLRPASLLNLGKYA